MASFLNNLLNKKTESETGEDRIRKEIEGMEFKKQTLINSVQGEIKTAEQQINQRYLQIGALMYDKHIGNQADITPDEHYEAITSLKSLITEKESKIKDITNRYDDEIGMMRGSLHTAPASVAMPAVESPANAVSSSAGDANCPQCGNTYNPGEDLFCMGCGNKLG